MRYTKQQVRAYHEAAHAVVTILLKEKFRFIALGKESLQLPDGSKATRTGKTIFRRIKIPRKRAMNQAVISMAAIVAEKVMRPHASYSDISSGHGYTDHLSVNKWMAVHLLGTSIFEALEDDAKNFVRLLIPGVLLPVTKNIVKSNWSVIVAVGDCLIEKQKLSYSEVCEIVKAKGQKP
jgi:hypothetical protein